MSKLRERIITYLMGREPHWLRSDAEGVADCLLLPEERERWVDTSAQPGGDGSSEHPYSNLREWQKGEEREPVGERIEVILVCDEESEFPWIESLYECSWGSFREMVGGRTRATIVLPTDTGKE